MTSAQFKLDNFEGPLDLLLHLINKHKLNIYDIEIALLLDQYMEYINDLDHEDYEDAADFLEMAARLIYIKTCSLLPQDEEAEELKKELEGRIIEYSICKQVAAKLRERFAGGDIFVRKPVVLPVNKEYTRVHEPMELYNAYMGISAKARKAKPLRASMFSPIVSHKIVSVTSKIIYVLKKLYKNGEFDMDSLYDGMENKSERVATFLAVLELTKSGRIFLNDDNSKIFFNSANKRKKISSDFDKEFEEDSDVQQTPEESTVDNFEEEAEQEDIVIEPSAGEVSLDEIEPPRFDYSKLEEHGRIHEIHKPKKSVQERRAAVECSAVIPDLEITPASVATEVIMQKSEEVLSAENVQENIGFGENKEEFSFLENEFDFVPNNDNGYSPNYWDRLRYRWGECRVGNDNYRNYWKYGYMRL